MSEDKVGEHANSAEHNVILLQQTKVDSNEPHGKFHYKSSVETCNSCSDDDRTSVSSSSNENNECPAEHNNEFESCFKNGNSTTKTLTAMKLSLFLVKKK